MKDFKRSGGAGKFGAKKTGGYKKDGARPSRGGFGASRGGARSFSKPTFSQGMHKATCSNCGKECEVPFKPIPGKPVLCRECFQKKEKGGSRDSYSSSPDRPSRRPAGSSFGGSYDRKPAFKKDFRNSSNEYVPSAVPAKDNSKELAEINTKLDRILAALADLEIDSDDEE